MIDPVSISIGVLMGFFAGFFFDIGAYPPKKYSSSSHPLRTRSRDHDRRTDGKPFNPPSPLSKTEKQL